MADGSRHPIPASKEYLDRSTIGGARPHNGTVHLAEYDPTWPALFQHEAARIQMALGAAALRIEHVGSTSVPGLMAKPVLDIVMEVRDSNDELAYATALEACGYELRIREPDWWEHRMLKKLDPETNLHVFTHGCPEVERMIQFRNHLRASPTDRKLYEMGKRELAACNWKFIQNYADAKTKVIQDILTSANAR